MNIVDLTLSFDGFELFVREIKAPNPSRHTIVFLHDSLGCVTLWRDFPSKLVAMTGYNAVMYDRRGYGLSTPYSQEEERETDYMEIEANILVELIRKLQLKKCSLFGHSDGATISLIAAAKNPQLINEIILVGPHIYVEGITRKGVENTFKAYQTTDLKERLEKYHSHRTDKMVNIWATIWLSDLFRNWNISEQIKNIVCDTLVFQGENDEFGTMQQVLDIQTLIQGNCEIVPVQNTGHTPHKDAPELVLEKLRTFF